MSLYLPIKVFTDDRLPQKICDKCSCKVNDFYQFCSEAIEVENRLRSLLLPKNDLTNQSVDLTVVKGSSSPPPNQPVCCHKTTQTDITYGFTCTVQVKEEPKPVPMSPVKEELTFSDHMDAEEDQSSDSEDMSLINLKQRKKLPQVNGEIPGKKIRKKNDNMAKFQMLMSSLPEGTELRMVEQGDPDPTLGVVKLENGDSLLKEVDSYHCCICFVKCYGRSEMLQHYRKHAVEIDAGTPPAAPPLPEQHPPRCTRCRKVVAAAEWAAHWARHWARDRRPYRCALCEKAFRDHHQILKHGLTHSFEQGAQPQEAGAKRFVCDLCPEAFVFMRFLLAHRTRAHPEAAGRALALRCGVCGRHFAHINSLRRHLRAHSGERNYLCNVCGKALSSREHLKFHIRIHTGYKPNVCKTCGKGFVKKCNLTLHERVHSGEKPHVCSHCGKAFSQRSTLVIHERYHSGARPYVCGLCGRGFVAKGLLSMHLKSTCI